MTLRYEVREFLRRDLRQRADYFANPLKELPSSVKTYLSSSSMTLVQIRS